MASSLKKFMEETAGKKAPGPSTSFSVFHLFYALELMTEKSLGRNKLAEQLQVGDGAVRTIISRLKDAGLIDIAKEGCSLTKKGQETYRKFEEAFPKRVELPKNELTPAEYNYAFLIKNSGQKIKTGIDQRDEAVIAGARSALVIVCKNNLLSIHAVSENVQKDYPQAADLILKEFKPKENDVIIAVSADSPLKAKNAAFAASWSLID